jgi:hypothetical protein
VSDICVLLVLASLSAVAACQGEQRTVRLAVLPFLRVAVNSTSPPPPPPASHSHNDLSVDDIGIVLSSFEGGSPGLYAKTTFYLHGSAHLASYASFVD